MVLSDLSVRRPVFATVIALLMVAFGTLSYLNLPVREFPDIDPPIVSVQTDYTGAAAAVVETRVTQLIEDQISGIEGVRSIVSTSRDGRSDVEVEFNIRRNVDNAANDIRDRVARVVDQLPDEVGAPEIVKVEADTSPIMWFNMSSTVINEMELTDYANRYIVDRLSAVDGVARVRIGGERRPAIRIWLNRTALAAHDLTVADIEAALRAQNVELPAGRIESIERNLTARVTRAYRTPEDFARLVVRRGAQGHLVRLGDVAKVVLSAEDDQREFRGNGEPMIGLGIIKQSRANTLDVAEKARKEVRRIAAALPEGMRIADSYDSSVFIRAAIDEVFKTLFIAGALVVLVIYLFLGSVRATIIPALTVPISLISSFMALDALGFSLNLLTLLALVLAIGLVVDDAIVVLENVHRRMEAGEPPLVAAFRGARQVAFAVVATTVVLVAVFVPIVFLTGNIGRLFSELAMAMAAAVIFSSVLALSLIPMMCSKLLKRGEESSRLSRWTDRAFERVSAAYRRSLAATVTRPAAAGLVVLAVVAVALAIGRQVPSELAPQEDRGAFFVIATAPEGTSFDSMARAMREIEKEMMPLVESGEANRLLVRTPRRFTSGGEFNSGVAIVVLKSWRERDRGTKEYVQDIRKKLARHPGVRAVPIMRQGLGRGLGAPVQFVIGGATYDELAAARDVLFERAAVNPGLTGVEADYTETRPQLVVDIDTIRAADLGVSVQTIGRTLETMLGSRNVTTFIDRGREYEVVLQGRDEDRLEPADLSRIFVRSDTTGALIPLSNLVRLEDRADAGVLSRFNKLRAITITANLAPDYSLGEALAFLEDVVAKELPTIANVDYKGQSLEYKETSTALYFTFSLAVLVVFLVLAAQFESFIHPFVIILTVPLAVAGAILGLFLTGGTLNVYSQIGIVMLVGLAAKNGILIVEFANQLRDAGRSVGEAILEASEIRFRPIVMTAVSTAAGAMPLVLATGAGAEARVSIGIVVFSGVVVATLLTLYVVPTFYRVLAGYTRSPNAVAEALAEAEAAYGPGAAGRSP